MLLRGQNLVGYRNYADDVVEAFIKEAADAGIDIFRVFDALNDERNFETSFRVIKKCGKHIQASISYSLTEPRLGGEVFTIDYYVKKARIFEQMGAESLCIKDMAGLMNPIDAYELVSALKEAVDIPIQLHCHYTSGMASMAYLKAIEAGVDVVDCAVAPFGLRTSEPAVEPIVAALKETECDSGLDLEKLFEMIAHSPKVSGERRIYIHGEKEFERTAEHRKNGIPILVSVVEELKTMGEAVGVPFNLEAVGRGRKVDGDGETEII